MGLKTLSNVRAAKDALRKTIDDILGAMAAEDRAAQSRAVQHMLLSSEEWANAKRIAFYLSMPQELQTEPLLHEAMKQGKACFAPICRKGDMKLLRLRDLEDLAGLPANNWGIREPIPVSGREDAMETGGLDLVVVPGVAFSRDGARLGHGRGFYDRFLQAHRALPSSAPCIAVAFKQQLVDAVPVDDEDEKVDKVLFPTD